MASNETSDVPFEPRRKLALVIGIGNYDNCSKLSSPENDADDMALALESIGFIVRKQVDLTRNDMRHIMIDFEDAIERNDLVLFYFAGHGIQWEDHNYLIPKDAPTLSGSDLNTKAINAQELLNGLSKRKPCVVIFLLDCCRRYHLRHPEIDMYERGDENPKSSGLAAMQKADALIAFACAPGTVAVEVKGERNGLFTKHLLKHITKKNEDIVSVLCDVTKGVKQESKGEQIPFSSAALSEKHICLLGRVSGFSEKLPCIKDQELKIEREIGCGGFGTVHRAQWLSQREIVAVKRLCVSQLDEQAEQEFFQEVSLMHRIRHPNIITFYGVCLERGKYAIVMEYLSLGSLYKVLHRDKTPLDWPTCLSMAFQAAKAINYLHTRDPSIVHCDIKSSNFLLEKSSNDYIVKICDFGLAQTRNETIRQTSLTTILPCTLQWTAPEILRLKKHTIKSDIYSLGIVYWELSAREIPYDGHKNAVVRESVLAGDRLEIPEAMSADFAELISQCWMDNPIDRPHSSKVIEMIEWCIESEEMKAETRSIPPTPRHALLTPAPQPIREE